MELFDIDIEDYRHLYKITKCGKVWSCRSNKFLAACRNGGNDYLFVNLRNNKKLKKMYVHRLVAITFLDNPDNYNTVDHIDNNKFNNHVHNLRWANRYSQQLNRCCGIPLIWNGIKNNKTTYFWEKTYKGIRYKKNSINLNIVEKFREDTMKYIYELEGEMIPSPDKVAKFYKNKEISEEN